VARPRSLDRDEVVHAAERQLRTAGYDDTTVDDISTATGLGRVSLYVAFDDKHGVFVHALKGSECGGGHPREPAHPRTLPRSGGVESFVGALGNHLPDELGQRVEDVEDETPAGVVVSSSRTGT
jgi:hypothetical protein